MPRRKYGDDVTIQKCCDFTRSRVRRIHCEKVVDTEFECVIWWINVVKCSIIRCSNRDLVDPVIRPYLLILTPGGAQSTSRSSKQSVSFSFDFSSACFAWVQICCIGYVAFVSVVRFGSIVRKQRWCEQLDRIDMFAKKLPALDLPDTSISNPVVMTTEARRARPMGVAVVVVVGSPQTTALAARLQVLETVSGEYIIKVDWSRQTPVIVQQYCLSLAIISW